MVASARTLKWCDCRGACVGLPGPPHVVNNSGTLTWNAPEYDGGSPVTGYYVERYVESSWDIVNDTPARADSLLNELSAAARSHNPCRIRAVNKCGVGPPSESVTLGRSCVCFACLT